MYAERYAFSQNPVFASFVGFGGNCTNFVSQCIYAGGCVMNYKPTFGWYYINANDKAPSWTGVEYLYRFLTRGKQSIGPIGRECSIEEVLPGDIVQLRFSGDSFQHSPVVVYAENPRSPADILVAAHSQDADNRPLNTYEYLEARYIHIQGIYRP